MGKGKRDKGGLTINFDPKPQQNKKKEPDDDDDKKKKKKLEREAEPPKHDDTVIIKKGKIFDDAPTDDTAAAADNDDDDDDDDAKSDDTTITYYPPFPSPSLFTAPSPPTPANHPLELGDFLTPLFLPPHPSSPSSSPPPQTIPTYALELTVGQTILYQGQLVEIVKREHVRLAEGPLNKRHQVRLEVVALFDREKVGGEGEGEGQGGLVFRGKETVERLVGVRRRRWCFLGLDGRKRELLLLRRQERDPDKREKVAFRLPTGGGIGEDIKDFFALADGDEEERFGMPVTVLMLEALGRYQVIGLGVGDWKALE